MRPRCEYGSVRVPEVARPGDVGVVVRRRRSRSSRRTPCTAWSGRRRPCRVGVARAAVAPPKFQIEDRVFGDGGCRVPLDDQVDELVGQAAQVVALPVAPVLAEGDDGVEELLDLRSTPSGRRSRSPARPARAAVGARARPRPRHPRRARRWYRPAGPRRPPGSPGSCGIVENSMSEPTRRSCRARKSRQNRIGPLPASIG